MSHLSPATLVLKRSTFLSTGQKNTLSLSLLTPMRLWAHHQALVPSSSPAKCGPSHSYTSQSFWEERAATSRTYTKGLESEYWHWGICAYTFSYVWALDTIQQDGNPAIFLPEFPKCWGMTSMCDYVQLVSFMWVWHITLCICPCVHAWRSEVDITYPFQLFLTLFEPSSLRELEVHYLTWWPARVQGLPVVSRLGLHLHTPGLTFYTGVSYSTLIWVKLKYSSYIANTLPTELPPQPHQLVFSF